MKQTTELAPNTCFNVTIKGMGSPYQIAQDLIKLANTLVSNVDGTIEPEELVSREMEYRTVVAQFDLETVEQDGKEYTLLDEHPCYDNPHNLLYDIVAGCVFTPNDAEWEEIREANAWDAYLLAVEQPTA
jgi:hypothetical protein